MKEEWKPIKGYKGYYEISNLGNVRSLDRYIKYIRRDGKPCKMFKASKIVKYHYFNGNIPYVMLTKKHVTARFRVDELVAKTWIDNPNKYTCVRHKDGDRSNNSIDNLEWVPYSYIRTRDNVEWRAIPGYEDLYQVSANGKVRSIRRSVDRHRGSSDDKPQYKSKELMPCRYNKKTGMPVYHLHRRVSPGLYGQTDEYFKSEDLIMLAFPELYEGED